MSASNATTAQPSPYRAKIKLYSDGAERATLLEMAKNPLISGMTTNPSLMKKAGVKDYKSYSQEILREITNKPISFEVFADDLTEMRRQALDIATWGKNVYVKIPAMNSVGASTTELVRELAAKGVKLNITAVFTLGQTLEIAQALKGGAESIISIFAGRIADSGRDPMPIMQAAGEICRQTDRKIELLWASTREVFNIVQAEQAGCDIITAPADIIKKLSGFNRDLLDLSQDTVKAFKADSEAAGFAF